MPDHDKARPLSGEIMTGGTPAGAAARGHAFTEAEFETVAPRGAAAGEPAPTSRPAPRAGLDFLREGDAAPRASGERAGPGFWLAGLIIVFGVFWVSGGHALVRTLPMPALFETQGPLRLGEVTSRVETRGGVDILFVEGSIENRGDRARAIPPLTISVNLSAGGKTRYVLRTDDARLAPGERYSFSSRLEAPAAGVESVSVTFQEGSL